MFLDFGTVKLGDDSLDGLNRRSLVNRLDVHGHDLRGFHIQSKGYVGGVRRTAGLYKHCPFHGRWH